MTDRGLRSPGMRDVGPEEMRRFRAVERLFLDVTSRAGYAEIHTPTVEPLHLYTAAGTLSPQALERVYSFLDWDGWSGERVVLRPDTTVAAARWYIERGGAAAPARVAYVQPSFRFAAEGDRELWQCGVEAFGTGAAEADPELLGLAVGFLRNLAAMPGAALGGAPSVDLAHAGLMRAAFAACGLSAAEQIEAHDRILDGDLGVTQQIAAAHPEQAAGLRLLAEVDGTSVGYIDNLRATLAPSVPAANGALDDLARAARALETVNVPYRVLAATARNFEYYSGITFAVRAGNRALVSGGRYDGLTATLGGAEAPACGWGADLLQLSAMTANGAAR